MTKKIFLFVDGTNLYSAQYKLFGPDKYLDFDNFCREVEIIAGISFYKIYFYASYSPQKSKLSNIDKSYLKNEALFYKSAKRLPNLSFFTGYRSKSSGKEKEVDVKLAVDMVDYCYQKSFDELYFCSGDADFNHALQIVKRFGKPIHLIGLESRIPIRLSNYYPTLIFTFKTNRSYDYSTNPSQKITFIPLSVRDTIKKL